MGCLLKRTGIVAHGISLAFRRAPEPQRPFAEYSMDRPFRWVYISTVDAYKHQWRVAEAVARLRSRGLPLTIDFYGTANFSPSMLKLQEVMDQRDPDKVFLRYHGGVAFRRLPGIYHASDAALFASTCENMPNILIEAMAAGLPLACSTFGPMPAILGSGGVYLDPEDTGSIARALEEVMFDQALRVRCAASAYASALQYSWERCARETFAFLREVAFARQADAGRVAGQ